MIVCDIQGEMIKHIAASPWAFGLLTLGETSHHVVRTLKQPGEKVHMEKT